MRTDPVAPRHEYGRADVDHHDRTRIHRFHEIVLPTGRRECRPVAALGLQLRAGAADDDADVGGSRELDGSGELAARVGADMLTVVTSGCGRPR